MLMIEAVSFVLVVSKGFEVHQASKEARYPVLNAPP